MRSVNWPPLSVIPSGFLEPELQRAFIHLERLFSFNE
jgi:hypothetical protein